MASQGSSDGNNGAILGNPNSFDLPNTETPQHLTYLNEFRTRQCTDFLQHKCTLHRPYLCFNWHFANQKRRRPYITTDGNFNYSPDNYCPNYDETSGICPNGDECPLLHRTAGDTERRFHLRYYKTCPCVHETEKNGHCVKNQQHCPYSHGMGDLRRPVLDRAELKAEEDEAAGRTTGTCPLNSSLETDRLLNEDPVWTDPNYVLANYKTHQCMRPLRLCRQGFACPSYHNPRDKRRSPAKYKYRSTPCPSVKVGEEWGDPLKCDLGDACGYCHTRTEQQFHLEIYKSSKCNDMVQTGYCPRGLYCAFAHTENEMNLKWDVSLVPGTLPLGAFVTTLPQTRRSDGSGDNTEALIASGLNSTTASRLMEATAEMNAALNSITLAQVAFAKSLTTSGMSTSNDASLLASTASNNLWMPEPIGKGREIVRGEGIGVGQLSGSLNEKYLTQQLLQRGLSLDLDPASTAQFAEAESYSTMRPSTMSVGSYMQYREALERHMKAQAEQNLQASGCKQSLSASGGKHLYQPYHVDRSALEGYLANNAAPPQTSTSTLPSTFFTDNETIESIVGNNDDDIDVNLGDLNSVLDRELSHEADVGTLSDSLSAGLNLSSSVGNTSFLGSSPMMIPMARTQQRHNSIGSVQAILENQMRQQALGGQASSLGGMGSGMSLAAQQAMFNSPNRQQLQQLRSQQEAAVAAAFMDQPSVSQGGGGDFNRQNYLMGFLGASGPGGGDQSGGSGLASGQMGFSDVHNESRMDELFHPTRLESVWEGPETRHQAEAMAAASVSRGGPRGGAIGAGGGAMGAGGGAMAAPVTYQQKAAAAGLVYNRPMLLGGCGMANQTSINGTLAACSLCHNEPYSVLSQPCQHLLLCYTCAFKITECPACRCQVAQWAPAMPGNHPPQGAMTGQPPHM